MLFLSVDDFLLKASASKRLSHDEEVSLYNALKSGDSDAVERLADGYLYFAASRIRKLPKNIQSLDIVYRFLGAIKREAVRFDFSRNGDSFAHRLSIAFQREITEYIANK